MSRPNHETHQDTVVADCGGTITVVYTSGMRSMGFHELILYGLSPSIGRFVIDQIAEMYKNLPGFGPEIPFKITGIGTQFMAKMITREQSIHRMGRNRPLVHPEYFLQIVWADSKSRWPWEEGFNDQHEQYIPLLFQK